jgi:hypothetical protein
VAHDWVVAPAALAVTLLNARAGTCGGRVAIVACRLGDWLSYGRSWSRGATQDPGAVHQIR